MKAFAILDLRFGPSISSPELENETSLINTLLQRGAEAAKSSEPLQRFPVLGSNR